MKLLPIATALVALTVTAVCAAGAHTFWLKARHVVWWKLPTDPTYENITFNISCGQSASILCTLTDDRTKHEIDRDSGRHCILQFHANRLSRLELRVENLDEKRGTSCRLEVR